VGISLSSLKRAKKASGIASHKTAVCTLWELTSTTPYPMPAMSQVRYDRSGNAHPFPNQQFNYAAMPQGMAPIFAPLDRLVGPLDPLGSVPQVPATMASSTEPPAIPAHLVEILTPEAHRAWYQKGVYLCRERLMLALHQNATFAEEDQESVFDIARTVVNRVIDDLFYPDQKHYAALVGYYRAVFEINLAGDPQG